MAALANATVGHAAAAIAAGYCNYAVCFRAGNLRSNVRLGQARGPERIPGGSRSFLVPWGAMAPAHGLRYVRSPVHAPVWGDQQGLWLGGGDTS